MRSDQTDPGLKVMKPRPDDWKPENGEPVEVDGRRRPELRDRGGELRDRGGELRDRGGELRDRGGELRDRGDRAGVPVTAGADPWQDIKGRFVDDPASAIAEAEQLVQQAVEEKIRELRDDAAAVCAPQGEDASSTEAMRTRLIRYQTYCQRLAGSSVH